MTPWRCRDLRAWNHAALRTFGDISVDASAPGFEATLAARDWPGLRLARAESPAAHVRGGQGGARPGWFVIYNDGGRCNVAQGGRQADLQAGEMSLLRAGRPYEIRLPQPNRTLIVALPAMEGAARLDTRLAVRHGSGESALLGALLRRLQHLDDSAAAALDAQALRHAIVDLLLLARPAQADVHDGLLQRALAIVQRDLSLGGLGPPAIAGELGISVRSLQVLFQDQGRTVTAHILEQRLLAAAQALVERPPRRIADVAMDAGFGDLSYFCRAFRRRFGCTARDWRRGR